jgi:serine/threonine-protein kinase
MDPKADPSLAETVASNSFASGAAPAPAAVRAVSPPPTPISGSSTPLSYISSDVEDEGRFLPGTLLGGRYRILTLLGRGGMGEVYRATDLTLGQSVALKFLPEEASRNQRLLERFHGEVRVARLVSHPNVCRVYDIGEIEGMPFISMEYVDGEDLASLLTRIGRLPADKAVETARKLCAGLAAAHDRGVIHRDLKPANIMMNKRGEVVIMDFGLAAIASELTGPEARNGTPAYMSPEQLKGSAVTPKSDLYALGLVLYELFTGKRPYDAQSVQHLLDLQEAVHLTSMTSVAADIDPAVEKVIRRCLDPDPARRPSTALTVLTALPGGDPLAAALAAGETPSPEMVAAAGKVEGMPRHYSVPCLALVVAFLIATIPIRQIRTGMVHGGLDQPPDVLAHQGRELSAAFGYPDRPGDSAVWLQNRGEMLGYLRHQPAPRNWEQLTAWEPAIAAVYREGIRPLNAEPMGYVDTSHPPQLTPGMTRVTLDGNGKLLDFSGAPPFGKPDPPVPVTPEAVFRVARLEMSTFSEVTPLQKPFAAFDQWRAWKGPHPHLPNTQIQIEIAWWKGRVVRVLVLYPWQQKPFTAADTGVNIHLRDVWIPTLVGTGAFFVVLLARRNWMLQRADRQGAFRIAAASFLLSGIAWVGHVHPIADESMLNLGKAAVADWLMGAAVLWFAYLAIEPEVRARWPHSVVTWNRVLAGRWLDAQVGSHILIGAAVGTGIWIFFKGAAILLFGTREPSNWDVNLSYFLGTRHWIGSQAGNVNDALSLGLFVFLTIFGMRHMLRRDWLAAIGAAVLYTVAQGEVADSGSWVLAVLYGAAFATLIFVLLRCGLVATISAMVFVDAMNGVVLGTDWHAWYVPASLATLLLLIGIAIFAFWRSLGGRELLESEP